MIAFARKLGELLDVPLVVCEPSSEDLRPR